MGTTYSQTRYGAMSDDGQQPFLEFTDEARQRVVEFMEEDDEELAVRIVVVSPSPLAPEYDMALVDRSERGPDEQVVDLGDFEVVMPVESAEMLEGTKIDWVESLNGSGFKLENPNLKPVGSEPLEGPVAERVQTVLEERVNPAVAQHGGQVSLVDVRENTVYVRMGGGCQGCGMAGVTLTQGIERMIKESVPEIDEIVDVTNHAAGDDPYY